MASRALHEKSFSDDEQATDWWRRRPKTIPWYVVFLLEQFLSFCAMCGGCVEGGTGKIGLPNFPCAVVSPSSVAVD